MSDSTENEPPVIETPSTLAPEQNASLSQQALPSIAPAPSTAPDSAKSRSSSFANIEETPHDDPTTHRASREGSAKPPSVTSKPSSPQRAGSATGSIGASSISGDALLLPGSRGTSSASQASASPLGQSPTHSPYYSDTQLPILPNDTVELDKDPATSAPVLGSSESDTMLPAGRKGGRKPTSERGGEETSVRTDRAVLSLQKELKKAWELIEKANEKEAQNRETIGELQSRIQELSKAAIVSRTLTSAQPSTSTPSLPSFAASLGTEPSTQSMNLDVQAELDAALEKLKTDEDERKKLYAEHEELKELFTKKQESYENEVTVHEKLDREVKELRHFSEQKSVEAKQKSDQIARIQEETRKYELLLKESKEAKEKVGAESELLNSVKLKLEQEIEMHVYNVQQLTSENQQLIGEIKMADEEEYQLKGEIKSLSKLRETMQRKVKQMGEAKFHAEHECDEYKSKVYALLRQLDVLKKKGENDAAQVEDLLRERELLSKNYLKAVAATQKQTNMAKIHEQAKKTLEQEIHGYKEEAAKQRKLILALEKERDRYVNDAAQMQLSKTQAEEEVIIKENQIFDYKKKVSDADCKLKQQQALYEQVRSDRNLYSKNLIESQDEISEMRRKLKIMSHQIEQYKEEISTKEAALLKEHFEHQKVEKEKEGAKQELQKLKHQLDTAQQFIQNQQAEENKLRHIIAEADSERMRQKKEYEAVIQERDILGTQLIRRNDELSLLYEKIKIQQSTLNKGEIQYRERIEDIRVLKLEIKKLRREKTILQHETTNVEALRHEIYQLQKAILNERTRVKVLEEELENPMNIHRWRKLSGSDPSTFELVQKVQTLQKRLIAKTEQVVEKEMLLHAKEKLYQDLRNMLVRVPGPEIVHQVESLKNGLKEKTKEMKSLVSELTMHQSLSLDYKSEIQNLTRQNQEYKKRYLTCKKLLNAKRQAVKKANSSELTYTTNKLPTSFAV